jgi:hypothetical protein
MAGAANKGLRANRVVGANKGLGENKGVGTRAEREHDIGADVALVRIRT